MASKDPRDPPNYDRTIPSSRGTVPEELAAAGIVRTTGSTTAGLPKIDPVDCAEDLEAARVLLGAAHAELDTAAVPRRRAIGSGMNRLIEATVPDRIRALIDEVDQALISAGIPVTLPNPQGSTFAERIARLAEIRDLFRKQRDEATDLTVTAEDAWRSRVKFHIAERDEHRATLNKIADRLHVVHEDPKILAAAMALVDELVEERHRAQLLHLDLGDAQWEAEILTATTHALRVKVEAFEAAAIAMRLELAEVVGAGNVRALHQVEQALQARHACESCTATAAKAERRTRAQPGRSLVHGRPLRVWCEPFGPAEVAELNETLPVLQRYDDPGRPPWLACLEVDQGGELPTVMRYGPFPSMDDAIHEIRRWRFVP